MRKFSIKIGYIILASFVFSLILIFFCGAFAGSKKKTIGVIMIPNIRYYQEIQRAFIETLFSEGITRDKVEIIIQKPLPDKISLMNTARKFAALNVDVIVSYGVSPTLAAVGEQTEIPVVFAGVFDPHAVGISLKNATGVSSKVSISNLLQKLKSISNFSKLGVLFTKTEKDTVLQADEIRQFEGPLKFKSVAFNIRRTKDTAKITGVDALLITTSCPVLYCINNIVDIARSERIPIASLVSGEEEKGVIFTVAANPGEQGREAARLVMRILKGEKVSSLPVVRPREIDTIINIKEASRLGIKVPLDLIVSSTKVIK